MQQFTYVPKSTSDVVDLLSSMFLSAPSFQDKTGFFASRDLDGEFRSLVAGLEGARKKLGEERFVALTGMAAEARSLCEADPDDKTGEAREARQIFLRMQALIRARASKSGA